MKFVGCNLIIAITVAFLIFQYSAESRRVFSSEKEMAEYLFKTKTVEHPLESYDNIYKISGFQDGVYVLPAEKNSSGFALYAKKINKIVLIGYSDSQAPTNAKSLPPGLQLIIERYLENLSNTVEPEFLSDTTEFERIPPLIKTKWGQDDFYNDSIPNEPVAGCVAIALAQVIKYWGYPKTGTGYKKHSCWYTGSVKADFENTVYNFEAMEDSVLQHQGEIARLIFHVGVSCEMDYGKNSSGAYFKTAWNALETYWDYDKGYCAYGGKGTDGNFIQSLRQELRSSRPVIMAGEGTGAHAFICDGADENGLFHFNWGWNGKYDGFFPLNAMNPGSHRYSNGIEAIIGLQPGYITAPGDTIYKVDKRQGVFSNRNENKIAGNNYKNKTNVSWDIDLPEAKKIMLELSYIDLGRGDTIRIFSNSFKTDTLELIANPDSNRRLHFDRNQLFIEFDADDFVTGKGFLLNYTSIPCNYSLCNLGISTDFSEDTTDFISFTLINRGYEISDSIELSVYLNDNPMNISESFPPTEFTDSTIIFLRDTPIVAPGVYDCLLINQIKADSVDKNRDTISQTLLHYTETGNSYPFYTNFPSEFMKFWIGNKFHANYYSSYLWGWFSNNTQQEKSIFEEYFTLKIGPLSERSVFKTSFEGYGYDQDERKYLDYGFEDGSKIEFLATKDGLSFEKFFSIDSNNYLSKDSNKTFQVPLGQFAGDTINLHIKITVFDENRKNFRFGYFAVFDAISNNDIIAEDSICSNITDIEIYGGTIKGGIGNKTRSWQKLDSGEKWETYEENRSENSKLECLNSDVTRLRRIVTDAIENSDTSEVFLIYRKELPQKPDVPIGLIDLCNTATSYYFFKKKQKVDDYTMRLEPRTAGNFTIIEDSSKIRIDWNDEFSGIAKISIAGVNECGAGLFSDPVSIEVKNPKADFRAVENDGNYYDFKNLSKNAETFEWDFGDGTTSNEFEPIHRFKSIGDFLVTLRAESNKCVDENATTVTVSRLSSIRDENREEFMTVDSYRKKILIGSSSEEYLNLGSAEMIIQNVLGVTVLKEKLNTYEFDIDRLTSGVYFITLRTPTHVETKRAILAD